MRTESCSPSLYFFRLTMLKMLFAFILLSQWLQAESLAVVTGRNSMMEKLSAEQVRTIFLKKRRYWKTDKLHPLNLPPTHALRQHFEEEVLHMSRTKLDTYWTREHYRGVRPPYTLASVKSVVLYIKKVKGSIGYIPVSKVDAGLKVLYRAGE